MPTPGESGLRFEISARAALRTTFDDARVELELDDRTLLDTLACVAHARNEPMLRRQAELWRLPQGFVLNANRHGVRPGDAAFVNAAGAHAQDFDDTQLSTTAHVSGVVWGALLAVAPPDTTGSELARASAAGRRFVKMMSSFVVPGHLRAGWHATGTVSALAAVVAIGSLTSDERTTWRGLGIAGSLVGGLRANNVTALKPLHAGRAAENAVCAMEIARSNAWSGSASLTALGEAMEFADAAELVADIPDDSDVLAKRYPSCSGTHPAVELALSARDAVRSDSPVKLTVPALVAEETTTDWPSNISEARMSLPYLLAVALARGAVDTDTIRLGTTDPEVRALFDRIAIIIDGDDTTSTRYQPWAHLESGNVNRSMQLVAPSTADISRKWSAARGDDTTPAPLRRLRNMADLWAYLE
ncbi:MAG TPA: MmgE/PrpD family protein [Amycolatopsis sp.]|nr:MmgE/PrpD family protein [Amycolatopsis sp.]